MRWLAREGVNGIDAFVDIRRRLPRFEIRRMFDVGANSGQTSLAYGGLFPRAEIYAFEPGPKAFAKLRRAVAGHKQIHVHATAVGATSGEVEFLEEDDTLRSRVTSRADAQSLVVPMTTIDEFCSLHNLETISYLKIDTEGHEREVLAGASRMLREGRISFIETECGLNSTNTYHVPFETIKGVLDGDGYRLFGIYRQVAEWPTGHPHLRRGNAVFLASAESEKARMRIPQR